MALRKAVHVALGVILALVIPSTTVRAEDFSIHLDKEADVDASRAAPDFDTVKVLTATETDPALNLPVKTYDVFLRLKGFAGNVRLGEALEIGPSTNPEMWPGNTIATAGGDPASVRIGWLRGAADLLIVAWVEDSDPRGNHPTSYHRYHVVRVGGGRVTVVMSRCRACSVRVIDFERGEPLEISGFSYDAQQDLLIETVTRHREAPGKPGDPLVRPWKNEGGELRFSASITEQIALGYRLITGGRPQLATTSLTYWTAGDNDTLDEIARYYLGPTASRQALLDANPELAARYKGANPADPIRLPKGKMVRIPMLLESAARPFHAVKR
jgi:hypothetical protein